MSYDHSIVAPGKTGETVLSQSSEPLTPPHDGDFLPAGDATITRSVKAKGCAGAQGSGGKLDSALLCAYSVCV
ncbi:hypothetical protein SAMN02746065_107178 [Desulfocicer vacuolatum DSM 3385]|uniref:Uncharacterized protein n=1 Tax=Desulfocicer vacuolatum DSM 3385 TaxID=1121400 RepID=A0A1W2B9P2_9BACT|nr:hypothetical protein SAMN02746065_107178 [Desulfocicer vacuolatum DSM 3385]